MKSQLIKIPIVIFCVMTGLASLAYSDQSAQKMEPEDNTIILPGRLESIKIKQFIAKNEPLKMISDRINAIFMNAAPDFINSKFFKPYTKKEPSMLILAKEIENKRISINYSNGNLLDFLETVTRDNDLKLSYQPGNYVLMEKAALNPKFSINVRNKIVADDNVLALLQRIDIKDYEVKSANLYEALRILEKLILQNKDVQKKLMFTPITENAEQNEKLQRFPLSLNAKTSTAYNVLNFLGALLDADVNMRSVKISASVQPDK